MSDEAGCGTVLLLLLLGGIIGAATWDFSDHIAYAEYRECLTYRKTAPSDTVVITMQPKCERWLRPETAP